MTHQVRQVRNEQGNTVVFIVLVIVLAVVGGVSTLRWTERKIRESQEQSVSKAVFEEFVRFACPPDTDKLLVVSTDVAHPAINSACSFMYLTLAGGDIKSRLRCVRDNKQYAYGTALCVKRESVTVDAFKVAAFKEPRTAVSTPRSTMKK